MKSLNLDPGENVVCEHPVCWAVAVDIHHIDPRSSFGSKRKHEQDAPENLVALCRKHHDEAHGPYSRVIREEMKEVAMRRIEENSFKRTKV